MEESRSASPPPTYDLLTMKQKANGWMAEKKYEEALDLYTQILSQTSGTDPEDTEFKLTIYLNQAMALLHLKKWSQAKIATDQVLQTYPDHVKALYRRSLALVGLKSYRGAKADVMKILTIDPTNACAAKQMQEITQLLRSKRISDKKAFSDLFAPHSNTHLYDDRQNSTEQLQKQEQTRLARRSKWHADMNRRKERGEDEISFDEWCKEMDESEKDAHTEPTPDTTRQNNKKEKNATDNTNQPQPPPSQPPKPRPQTQAEIDEEDQKVIEETKKMGYCYFRREVTDDQILHNSTPQKIDSKVISTNTPPSSQSLSDWNIAGTTYEEKDMSQWAQLEFKNIISKVSILHDPVQSFQDSAKLLKLFNDLQHLQNQDVEDSVESLGRITSNLYKVQVKVLEIKDLKGEAHVAVIRGVKRYIFEFSCIICFECTVDANFANFDSKYSSAREALSENIHCLKGEIELPEISSTAPKGQGWLSGMKVKFYKTLPPNLTLAQNIVKNQFADALSSAVDKFMKKYKEST